MPLRDYQQECHDDVLSAWGESPWHTAGDTFRTLLVNMATSAGKTVTVGAIINSVRARGKCLFIADTDELCGQPVKTFNRLFQMHPSLEKAGERASVMADVVVGSAQTLAREERLHRFPTDHFQYIFVDEAHRGSDRNKKITDHFPAAKVMGMTATPFRAKLADLSGYYEHVVFELGVFDLIDEGFIAPLKILTLPVKVDIRAVHQKQGDYDSDELDTTIRPYYEEICRLLVEHAEHRHIIAYLPLIKSSQEFAQIAFNMGINARHVDGKSPDRKDILAAFARGEFQLLSNSSLLTTGWDCPRCDCLLNLAPTRSPGLFRQKVGRIGRILPGVIDGILDRDARKTAIANSRKPDALILDLLWQTEKFDLQGPSDLIANNERERKEIQARLRGLSEASDLQGVTAEVQEAHEQKLKEELIAAAERQKKLSQRIINAGMWAIEMVAATLRARKVLNYEPTSSWHRKPVTDKQKTTLANLKVDPATVKDAGHASAMLDVLLGRLRRGMPPALVVEALEAKGVAGATFLTDSQAFETLQGDYPLPFSQKHYGKPLRQVPPGFWEWCKAQAWVEKRHPMVWKWIQSHDPEAKTLEAAQCRCINYPHQQAPNCPVHPRHETEGGMSEDIRSFNGDTGEVTFHENASDDANFEQMVLQAFEEMPK